MKVGHSAQDHCSHAASLLAGLNLQRKQVQFCDCVIRNGQGQVYPVQRCILAASSPVLASILSSTGALVELEAACLSDSILGPLFDYIYTGTLPYLNNKTYSDLLAAAQYLEMDKLQNALKSKEDVLEYHNTSDKSTKFTLLPSTVNGYESSTESAHSGCSTQNIVELFTGNIELSKDQIDSPVTHLSFDAETEDKSRRDGVCTRRTDACITTSEMTVHNCCIPETDLHSHSLIQSSGGRQQVSIVCQDREKDQSAGATKPETWQECKEEELFTLEEEAELYSSGSAEEQENENIRLERTLNLCLRGEVKAEEMRSNSGDVKKQDSPYCSTPSPPHCGVVPVICHSNRAAVIQVAEVSTKPSRHTEGHLLQQDRPDMPEKEYNSSATDRCILQNNKPKDNEQASHMHYCSCDSEDDSNKDFAQIRDMSRVTPAVQNITAPSAEENANTGIDLAYKRICVKRKLKEEDRDKCSKAAKTVRPSACTTAEAETVSHSSSVFNQNMTSKLFRSGCGGAEQTYHGHLYYHCQTEADTCRPSAHTQFSPNIYLTPDFSPNYSDESSEENDVPLFGISSLGQLQRHSTLGKEQIVLLDINANSAEMLVSYEHTSDMKRASAASFTDENMKIDCDDFDAAESQISEGENQGGNVRHRASSHEGGKILTTSLTSFTSACGKDCMHDSVSPSSSDRTPRSPATGMQTNISEHLSAPGPHTFQCSLCEHSFSQRGSLNRHVRSHLGVRPFPCPQCPMTFSRQYRVTEHMRVHQRSALGSDFPKPPAS